ncbi:MAG TPA: hypothetical protein VMS77_02655 [Conexivisphaerales archaeon]|nr:hypothetical protein [Conexivisphaerales archaeon]
MSAPVRRCIWCGKSEHVREVRFNRKDRITVPFCSDECIASARRFLEFDSKYSRTFYVLEFTLAFACLILVMSKLVFYASLVAMGIGALMIPFPFLAAVLGGRTYIKRAILITRVIGVAIVVAGAVVAYLFRP